MEPQLNINTGNFALLPLRTRTRGPAIQLPALPADVTELTIDASHESYDPLDEILALFRANTFFRNFEIKGPADRVLIYGILYVSEVLSKIKPGMSRRDAEKVGAYTFRYLSALGRVHRADDILGCQQHCIG